ncbi:FecR family protein, partial [Salinibacter altiplanensis]|uniref:FecR family protein n=1 Tax=Salinibacter altiplanensis TaxID=1803181 RepID=UPI001F2416B6
PRRSRRHSWRVAVGLAVAAVVLVGGLWLWRQPVTVTAPPGQQSTATLPDGSTVDLNSGTTLTHRRDFQAWPFLDADRRAVQLEGEAFFAVADEARPFVIETASAEVAVTGTRFNVRSRPDDSAAQTEVTLVEGRVEVAARTQSDRRVVLSEPGEASRVAGPGAAPSAPESTATTHALAWRTSGFAARARPLVAVLRDLERRFDATLRLHDSVDRTRAPVSLYYPEAPDLETILHDLCTARDLNYRPTSRGFELFAAPDDR